MDKLEYLFRLINSVSAPAKAMKTDVEKVVDAIEEMDKALKEIDKTQAKTKLEKTVDPLKKQRLQLQLSKQALLEQKQALQSATQATGGYSLGTDIMSGVIQGAISKVAGLAVKTLELGVAGAKFATDAIAFKEQTLTALRVMTGTESSAQRIFGQALDFAKKTPFGTRDVLGGFTQLLGAGFKEDEVATVFAAIGDAAAASGFDQQVIDRMVVAFAQIKAKGRLMGQEMLQVNEALGRAGVGTTSIYDEMAKKLGKTRAEVMKLQESGQIDSDTAIFSIIKALEQKSGGAVGNLMAQQSKTLTGLLSTLASAPGDFFMSLDLSKLPGFDAIKGFVGNMVKLLDTGSVSGKRLQDVMGKLYNTVMGGLFGGLDTSKGLGQMESIALRLSDAVEDSLPALRNFLALAKGFGTGLFSGLLSSLERLGGLSNLMAGGPQAQAYAEELGKSLGSLVSKFLSVGEAVLFMLRPILAVKQAFDDGLSETGRKWGASLVDGLREGIMGARFGPLAAIRYTVDGVTGLYESMTETNSPSRLFARYGAWATEGWALGLESGLPGAMGAVGELANVGEDAGAAEPVGAAAPRAFGALGGNTFNVTVALQMEGGVSEDGEAWAQRQRDFLARELPGVLTQAMEQANAQLGG